VSKPLFQLLLTSDASGVQSLLDVVPPDRIAGIVGASNRPAGHDALRKKASEIQAPFIIQPPFNRREYPIFLKLIERLSPDGLICRSYSMLVRDDIRELVGGYAFNMHASLLPRHRGPNPIQWALISGDERAGVSLHVMDGRFDGGDIISQESLEIDHEDNWVTLGARLSKLADSLMAREAPALLSGAWHAYPQDESLAKSNPRIPRQSLPILFDLMSDREIYNLIRAQSKPLVGAYVDTIEGRRHFPNMLTLDEIRTVRNTIRGNSFPK
jgi:methionyl-tRNA formyltransferase